MNVTPLLAIAILLPHVTKNSNIQFILPLSLFIFKDIFLGFHSLILPVYFCVILFVILGKYMSNVIYATLTGVLMWHLIVNYFVWLLHGGSLLNTYLMAVPFDFNLLVSTLICVVLGKLCIEYYYRYSVYLYR